jgi:hypothetical protein
MTLDRILSFVIDYTKFIATLWATYIGLNVTIIGWLLTLRSMKSPLPWSMGLVVIAAYLGVSYVFRAVLRQNDKRLLGLMEVADVLADIEARDKAELKEVYGRVFRTGNASELLRNTENAYLGAVVAVTALFMVLIVFIPPTPPTPDPATLATPAH